MGNVLRISFLGLLITLAASQAQAQAGDSGGDKGEPIRVVISKVNGLGTVDYNVSAKSVSYKGVRMIALAAGNRYSLARNGSFAVTDQVSQLNFVLPSRVYALSVRESVCLDRLQGMKTAGKDSGQMEITFRGRKIAGSGNYLVAEILGCGDLVTGGIESGTPTPAPATPTPGGAVVPTVAPTGKPTVIPTAAVTSTPTTVSPSCTITAQRVGTSNQCTVTVQSTGGAVTGGALSRRNADGVETLKTPVTLTTQSLTNTSTRDCALRGVTFSASVTGVGGTIGNCGPAAVLAVPPTPTPRSTATPTPRSTATPTSGPTATPTLVPLSCSIAAQRIGKTNQCTVTVRVTGGRVTGGTLQRQNADGVETLKTAVTLTSLIPVNTTVQSCAVRGVTFSASVSGVGGSVGKCGPVGVPAVPVLPTPTPKR